MEAFKFYILPIVKKMTDKRIRRLLPGFIESVDYYIRSVESSEENTNTLAGLLGESIVPTALLTMSTLWITKLKPNITLL